MNKDTLFLLAALGDIVLALGVFGLFLYVEERFF